jgi:hypothetical protein
MELKSVTASCGLTVIFGDYCNSMTAFCVTDDKKRAHLCLQAITP